MTIRQEINIIDVAVSNANTTARIVQLDTTQYVNPTYYFEIVAKITSGTVDYTLQRVTGGTNDATITVSGSTYSRFRSSSFSPPAGQTEYRLAGAGALGGATVKSARIIVIDNPTTLTSTETQIEIGNEETGKTNTTAAALTNPKYWLYTAANWDGTKTFYAELTFLTSTTQTVTATLQEDNGSFASWTDKVTIASAVSSTTATRRRSAAFTPTDGRHYRISALESSASGGRNYSIYNAKIIVDQSDIKDSYLSTGSGASAVNGSGGTSEAAGQSFTTTSAYSLGSISLQLLKVGTPTDNLYVEIRSTSVTGTLLATSNNVAASTLTTITPGNYTNFTFSSPPSLSNSTKYYILLYRTGSRDTSNFARWLGDPAGYSGGGNYGLDSGVWSAESGTNDNGFKTFGTGIITLLEPQYLLLNTSDSGSTGLQSYPQLWDSTEWSGVTNFYKYSHDATNASDASKLVDITASSDISGATVTGANQQISSSFTMPTTGHEFDVNVTNTTGVVGAGRVIVQSTVTTGGDLLVSVTDNSTVTESLKLLKEHYISVSDSSTVTDSLGETEVGDVNISETPTATDVLRGYSDNVFVRDFIQLLFPDTQINVFDLITIGESFGAGGTGDIVILDSSSITESINLLVELNRRVQDTSNIQDSVVIQLEHNPNVSDESAVNDDFKMLETSFVNVNETTSVSDTANVVIPTADTYDILAQDSSTITENAVVATGALQVSVSDGSEITENTLGHVDLGNINVTDSSTVTDAISVIRDYAVVVSDSLSTPSESVEILTTLNINVNDTSSIGESLGEENTEYFVVNDTTTITESVSLTITELFLSVSDSMAVTDSIQRVLVSFVSTSESTTVTESITLLIPTLFITVSDSSGVTDSSIVVIPSAGVLSVAVSDGSTVTDAISVTVSNPQVNVTDTSAVTENTVVSFIDSVNVSDTSAVTNSTTVQIPFYVVSKTESSAVTDSPTVFIPFLTIRVSDTTTITDQVTTPTNPRVNIAESVPVTELVSVYAGAIAAKIIALTLDITELELSLTTPDAIDLTLGIPSTYTITLTVPDSIDFTLVSR